jgi:serine protease inhibitor
MLDALRIAGIPRAGLNAASKAAGALLNSSDTNIILSTANALWYRQSAKIRSDFLAENQQFFASTIQPLDFANVPAAEAAINQWASDQTHGRITGIANGLIDPLYTDLVLANAIYFKGKWDDPFDQKLTKDRAFHPAAGAAHDVPMMEMFKTFSYRRGSGYQAVRLPYQGGNLGMYVFLPDPGASPTKLLQIMNGDNWRRITVPGFADHEGLVVLPKFKMENTFDLTPPLQKLGMKIAFDQKRADFSGMFKDQHYISAVRQKTFVEVAEEGTEAAAVTAIAHCLPSGIEPPKPKPFEMIVDRPFLFAIVDARTEMILFMGVVNTL